MRHRVAIAIALVAIAAVMLSLVAGAVRSGSPLAREGSELQSQALQRHMELFGVQNREGPAS